MVRLITVIGHGVDLIEHHINHYLDYVDEINYVVYETDLYPTLSKDVEEIIKPFDNVKIVKTITERIFDWERVTKLYNEIKLTKPNDWWVIADIDEFHLYPEDSLDLLMSDCEKNGWEIVRGGFIDRIGVDGTFPELNKTSIWEQFPNGGMFRYYMSLANPNKICLCKGYIEITNGQHFAKIHGETTWRYRGWSHPLIAPISTHTIQVHHFKWDKTSIDRIKCVADVGQEYAYSNEYGTMYKSLVNSNFLIDITNDEYMIQQGLKYPEYNRYRNWNKLIKKITSI